MQFINVDYKMDYKIIITECVQLRTTPRNKQVG